MKPITPLRSRPPTMVAAKTPLRIPLAGGLTDLRPYAERFGGVTVSATIDKYVYVALKPNIREVFDLKYQDVHVRPRAVDEITNDLIRESLRLTGSADTPVELVVMTDLAGESGLGTSGAITVTLLNALHRLHDRTPDAARLYTEAAEIEVDILGGASGYHDPTICATGGLKLIEYDADAIRPRDLAVSPETLEAFERSLLLFYSGHHARSKPSLDLLTSHLGEATERLHDIKALGFELGDAFEAGDLHRVAHAIGAMQELKQGLPGSFEDDYVRDVTARVAATGATAQLPGGKISAFVLVCCPDGQHGAVRDALSDLREVDFRLDPLGARAVTL